MKYTSSILLDIFWISKFATLWKQLEDNLENDLYLSLILWVHQEFSNEVTSSISIFFRVRSVLEVDFQNLSIYCQSILEVEVLNLQI